MKNRRLLPLVLLMTVLSMISSTTEARVYSGLEVFLAKYTRIVKGKRVGLITNQTGVDARIKSTVDLLSANPNVNLVALFAPEHGIRGDARAGENVPGGKDPKTRLPIYTLYGAGGHRPSKAALSKIDVLIYDIQDVGSRAYTYIWHLAECMSAAAEAGKTVIVLDRPNPLGAVVVDGPVSEQAYLSFIGLYPIPRVYGMTVGELARYLNTEEKIFCRLMIVPMINYRRGMSWSQTGLSWVPTSPNIPTPEAACAFAATGTIGEMGCVSIGIGYTLPFQTVAAPWINAEKMSAALNRLRLPGVRFRPIHYKPFYAAYANKYVHGIQLMITNPGRFRPATTETAMICYLRDHYSSPRAFRWRRDKIAGFDKAMGTSTVRREIVAGKSYRSIVESWRPKINSFKRKRAKYLIYK